MSAQEQDGAVKSAEEFARTLWWDPGHTEYESACRAVRERDAAIRRAAIEECANDLDRYSEEETEKRGLLFDIGNGPYRKIMPGYDEGFIDALDLAEQRIRALAK